MDKITKGQFTSNAIWKMLEQFTSKGVSLLVSVFLTRMLAPEDYGLIAITAIFTNLSDILIDGGFGTALVRKNTIDEVDCSSVFSVNMFMAVVLYFFICVGAPYISNYYDEPDLTLVLRVITITFFLQAFSSVRTALITRKMLFRQLFYCNTAASIISGVVGILSAYYGLGVWALVLQRIIQTGAAIFFIQLVVQSRIAFKFDLARMKQMWLFGIGVLGSSLLNYMGGNIYNAVVGKTYSVKELGYSDKGNQLPMQISLYTFGAMSSTLLPTLSLAQNETNRFRYIVRRVVGMTSFLILPLMIGLSFISREVIVVLFTDKWMSAVPLMKASCIYYLATPFMLIDVQVFFSMGHSEKRVKTECIRILLMISSIIVFGLCLKRPLIELAWISSGIAVLTALVTHFEVDKLIAYPAKDVAQDIWKPVVSVAIMCIALFAIDILMPDFMPLLTMAMKILIGMLTYLFASYLLQTRELKDIIDMAKNCQQIFTKWCR